MKKLVSFILSLGLVVCIFSTFNSTANAQTNVEPGFYVDHKLSANLSNFAKMSKKEKKALINEVIQSKSPVQLVMGGVVYDFIKILGLPAGVEPTGTPVEEYDQEFTTTPVTQEFRILSIE